MFSVVSTSQFDRLLARLLKKDRSLGEIPQAAKTVLSVDPYNLSRQHKIKKLTDIPAGDGPWRFRVGKYRIRYDIVGTVVILKLIRHRRDSYGGKDA